MWIHCWWWLSAVQHLMSWPYWHQTQPRVWRQQTSVWCWSWWRFPPQPETVLTKRLACQVLWITQLQSPFTKVQILLSYIILVNVTILSGTLEFASARYVFFKTWVGSGQKCVLTCDAGLEWTAWHVSNACVLDGDEIVAGGSGHVGELIAFLHLTAIQLDLAGAINGHSQGPRTSIGGVHNEFAQLAYLKRKEMQVYQVTFQVLWLFTKYN